MARQMRAISNNPRLRRNQIAELNARQSLLPQIIANKQRQEELARQEELKNIQVGQFDRSHELEQSRFAAEKSMFNRQMKQQRRASEVGMGLEAAKLGMSVANRFGDKTLGDLSKNVTGTFSQGGGTNVFGSTLGNVNLGSAVSGTLMGFGASRMLGKKTNKLKKAAVGAGVGALTGLLSGGSAIAGGFGGGIGSLFL